jgi:DNA modification methylase
MNQIKTNINNFLSDFSFHENETIFSDNNRTRVESITINNVHIPTYTNEFWTPKQRRGNPLHEISYRACFKPQLPKFFIELMTKKNDIVYDPFSGRGTTVLEAALMNRNIIANDINPLFLVLAAYRFLIPDLYDLKKRLEEIKIDYRLKADIDLSMFYHKRTESELVSLRNYLKFRKENNQEDNLDKWIRMVATNRLTGHSRNFFSVYTLPPNQAISPEKQIKINKIRNQIPEYRNINEIILIKSKNLIKEINDDIKLLLLKIYSNALFLNKDARYTSEIKNNCVSLTVTSPPFLNIVNYFDDNWLRCWFNDIDINNISITMTKNIDEWTNIMQDVFHELYRITKKGGWVAFEVGEVNKGLIKLDEYIVPIGINAGFECHGILINSQKFTKTSNIWGIKNNTNGTNTNRIVMFKK